MKYELSTNSLSEAPIDKEFIDKNGYKDWIADLEESDEEEEDENH